MLDDYFVVSHVSWADKFNEINISSVMCTVELVGHGRLTTILTNKVNGAREKLQ